MIWRRVGVVAGAVAAVLTAEKAQAQTALPEIVVTTPSPIVSRRPARRTATRTEPAPPAAPAPAPTLQGTLPVVTDQFATVTVVPDEDIRHDGGATLGDLLNSKPGITGSSFAPGAASRPIIRGLDVNRVRIQEEGVAANGASDLGEDHFVPVDPLTAERVEVIRGPATLRFGTQAIGGVVDVSNNRIPTMIPRRGISTELRGSTTSVDRGIDGAVLLDAGGGNVAIHADMFGRRGGDYRVPGYPYLTTPDPAEFVNVPQPGNFNGRQPNSSYRTDGGSLGGSYIFSDGFVGLSVSQQDALYHIPTLEAANGNTRIDAKQTKVLSKGEWRAPSGVVDAVRYWFGATDYFHAEKGLEDPADASSDTVHQIFTNREQEGRVEVQLAPFDLRFASLTTAIGVSGGHQKLTAPSPEGAGLWDPNTNRRVAGYIFNEFQFTPDTKAQIAGRIEQVDLSGMGRDIAPDGTITSTAVAPNFTPVSGSVGVIHNLPWNLVASLTGQYVERAPKPAEIFSGGVHEATGSFDKGNPNLGIESAYSVEAGLRRATGPLRFELTGYLTRFNGFIYRHLTGNMCDEDGVCGAAPAELTEAVFSQANATFRGVEFQSQFDVLPVASGMFGIETQFDAVRATFADGTNVPRIPPVRYGGGFYWRDANWLARVNLLHAEAQNNIAIAGETTTPGYNNLRAELTYTMKRAEPLPHELSEISMGVVGSNLLNDDIRNHVSFSKDQVLMPGANVRVFARVKY